MVSGGRGQQPVERHAAGDGGGRPYELLHARLRQHPGTARLAPARRGIDGHLHAELAGKPGRIEKGMLPFRRHVDEAVRHDLRRSDGGVDGVDAADTDALHPFEIAADARLRDVAVHPVPPDARQRRQGRRLESVTEKIAVVRWRRFTGRGGQSEKQASRKADDQPRAAQPPLHSAASRRQIAAIKKHGSREDRSRAVVGPLRFNKTHVRTMHQNFAYSIKFNRHPCYKW